MKIFLTEIQFMQELLEIECISNN